jgi:hypothetical protein
MRKIYKYVIPQDAFEPGICSIAMPRDSTILSFGSDVNGQLCIWAAVNPNSLPAKRRIACRFTGEEAPVAYQAFIGTHVDRLVYHCFACGWEGELTGV